MVIRWMLRVVAVLLAAFVLFVAFSVYRAQRADYGWRPSLVDPSAKYGEGPAVVIDHAHHNGSNANWWGRYWPFAELLRADGYRVSFNERAFTPAALADMRVLVIANASGGAKPQFMGINLPIGEGGDRAAPAFSTQEIAALTAWVEGGGRLLLIADHAPFGAASAALGKAFGVRMRAGFLEVPEPEKSDPLRFTRGNGRLGTHPILSGIAGEAPETGKAPVNCVQTFTGQSLDGPPGSTVLLRVPDNAIEYVDDGKGDLQPAPAGAAQGLAFERGRGRVVVLGEAAMLTAQVSQGEPFGMNLPGCDNERFARNVMRWLSE